MAEYGYSNAELACSSSYILPVIRQELEGLPPGSVVLDLGCGNGSLLAAFRSRGWVLQGLEISNSGLAEARQAYPDIEFHCADLTTDLKCHPLAGRCNAVISTEVVEHLLLPRMYAQNCFDFLASNGRLIISTPYHGYLKNLALAVAGATDAHFTALWDCGHIKFWSKSTLSSLLSEAGFVVDRFVGVGRVPFLWKSMILVARKP